MSTTVKTLFTEATSHRRNALKSERRAAFEKLRQLSQYGSAEEMAEAQIALTYSHLYKLHDGDMAAIVSALESAKEN
jgi:hypothetical protein